MKYLLLTLLVAGCLLPLKAQDTYPLNGNADKRPTLYAFTQATIVTDFQTTIPNGTLLIENGRVKAVGVNLPIPPGAIVTNLNGKYIYPSFVELHSNYGLPEPQGSNAPWFKEQFVSEKRGAYNWNQAITPELKARDIFSPDEAKAAELRSAGFGAALVHVQDGIARGSSALVSLAKSSPHEAILKGEVAAHYSFSKGKSTQSYPSSLTGTISLLRQTHYDAIWYKNPDKKEYNISLEAWNRLQGLPQFFEVNDKLDVLRADKLGDEFGIQYIIKSGGNDYQRLSEIKATNAPLILPVNFPDAYDVENPLDAHMVSINDLKHWELAPSNPGAVSKAGIPFALTSHGLKQKSDLLANIRKAILHGLDKKEALKALTFTPARLLGMEQEIGSLKPGAHANFLISSKEIFEEENVLFEHWIQGKRYQLQDMNPTDLRGEYVLRIASETFRLTCTGPTPAAQNFSIVINDTTKYEASFKLSFSNITLSFDRKKQGRIRLNGYIDGKNLLGTGQLEDGTEVNWQALYQNEIKAEDKKPEEAVKPDSVLAKVTFPFSPFGYVEKPKAGKLLIRNATVWTSEKDGKLENTDVLVVNGKITSIGKNLSATDAQVIDGTGKHLTPGIIDEHSHIAISRGVNEGAQISSAEVRMEDVINPDDINIYRALSGGVTSVQLLHGSANAIGGQSALIKLRWGAAPSEMLINGADKFIKFALGENPTRMNWGSYGTERYPQTRMGMEQVYMDYFTRAREYEQARKTNPNIRRDLDLDAVAEILAKKRFISCHSYVQSEINMLMKVADKFGFKINTFTHILEGYKVADKMRDHGAAGSSFADWWAYKWEVKDAIPFNAALMSQVGVNTAINSDDAEMCRRLNQEAAKAVKYGGASEEDALKMVTINPARMLHLDQRTGSIKIGKDADLVLWTDHPLSIYAKADKTIVDGIVHFDRSRDAQLREELAKERNRLIQKMIGVKQKGGNTQKPMLRKQHIWDCEDLGDGEGEKKEGE